MIKNLHSPEELPEMRRIALVAAFLMAIALPARADKDCKRMQVQVTALQGQIADMQRKAADSVSELQRLTQLVAEQNALLKAALDAGRQQDEAVLATMNDLSGRLSEAMERLDALRVAGNVAAPVAPGSGLEGSGDGGVVDPETGEIGGPVPAPRELYSQAYADFARGNYDLAIQGFTEYMTHYPETDFTDNAQYWIGESIYGKKQYGEAIEAWNTLFRSFPSSDKVPDGRVKKGMALERLGRRSQALVEYRYVVDRYPTSPAARIARERLNP
jgi:tol-pal system protein YbgF